MRIAFISAGAAGMYCGTCLNDNALARALMAAGEEVVLVPTYTPMRVDEESVAVDSIFFGAVNTFLEARWPWTGRIPRWLRRPLDSKLVLGWASRYSGSTDPRDLGALTLSMLDADRGPHLDELRRLAHWLSAHAPEVVILSNSLFLGMAPEIKRVTGARVVCLLQGEDLFLDGMIEPWKTKVHDALRRLGPSCDRFVVPSDFYRDVMAPRLGVGEERFEVVHLGVTLEGLGPPATVPERPFTVGYLARLCEEKGLGVLIDAFLELERRRPGVALLRLAGWIGADHRAFIDAQIARVAAAGLAGRVEMVGEVDHDQKVAFLHSIDVLAVPTLYREPKGRFALEAMACGVPLVLPRHGTFPDLIATTGAGLLHAPGDPGAVAEALERLIDQPDHRAELAAKGLAARETISSTAAASAMREVLGRLAATGPV